MHARLRRLMRQTAVATVALLTLTACASVTDGQPANADGSVINHRAPAPDANLQVYGDSHGSFDTAAKNALSDVFAFWKQVYPSVSDGKSLPPIKGGLYSVDGAKAVDQKRVDGPAGKEACIKQKPETVIDNAAFCFLDDSIIWDRASNHLLAVLAAKYGTLLVALVFAHEFGHAIQSPRRLNIDPDNKLPTIYAESQADCASGAFIGSALAGDAPHFPVTAADVDRALDGFLLFRDSTPQSPADISHGNGFDRLSAFDDGIQHGVTYCYSDSYFSSRKFTERGYVPDTEQGAIDAQNGGNETLAQVLNAGDPKTDQNAGGLQPDLNRFWKAAAASIKKSWADVKIAEAPHPKCGASSTSEFGYCPDDNTVYYSADYAKSAYYSLTDQVTDPSTAVVTIQDNQPADFALGTMFAMAWGLAVRHQLFAKGIDDKDALLAAACYTGAYAKDINRPNGDATHSFILSPPDMDEATSAMLSLVGSDQSFGARGTTGLDRIQAFVKGYDGALSVC
ncbi:MAG: hypothetical protein ABI232_13115 [Jatrophihabitantaceae bacterium]